MTDNNNTNNNNTNDNNTNEDLLILVDESDNIIGYDSKFACHKDNGKRHRAFSIFIFNSQKELLIQKRSAQKPLWPLIWSNSVCSHPRRDESYEEAVHRRLIEEIGIDTPLQFLFKFQYQVKYKTVGSENELCSVYIGMTDNEIKANPDEIAEWKYMNLNDLDRDVAANPENYSPWFKIEWNRIREFHMQDINNLSPGG
jgi:isopentenyl-diphosphate Delta-isomerase